MNMQYTFLILKQFLNYYKFYNRQERLELDWQNNLLQQEQPKKWMSLINV